MLRIQKIAHLARQLGLEQGRLLAIAESHDQCCHRLNLHDPAKPEKIREVLHIDGPLRMVQDRLYTRVLLPRLTVSPHSYGGIRGRHIKQNATPHIRSRFAFTADIGNFYPTITHKRIYNLFCRRFMCSPDVARICTKVCTYNHHLALGLVTSPILADQVLSVVDRRIASACASAGIVYTRFVDDITLSADFDLSRSGYAKLLPQILADHGFRSNSEKTEFGRLSDGIAITKLRIRRGRIDVRASYVEALERQMVDAARLAAGQDPEGPYFTEGQIRGRLEFVAWVNRGRRRRLMRRFKSIAWDRVRAEATKRRLVSQRKELVAIS